MGWYDFFSRFYDSSVEKLYVDTRVSACEALNLEPGQTVLDLPCGTGQAFEGLVGGVGDQGTVVGLDFSAGMLKRAQARVDQHEWSQVHLGHANVHDVTESMLHELTGRERPLDRLHIFCGLSAFPQWEQAFERLWGLLRPGGRCVIVDCHSAKPNFQGRMVNLVARAEIQRETWVPLEKVAQGFERRELPSLPQHGGTLILASGDKS